MTWIFEAEDKTRRKIHLTNERWSHIQKHPDMSGKLEEIKDALKNPDTITEFEFDPAVHFYYRYDKTIKQYLFISVKYLNGEGFIITSFHTDKIQ